MQNVIELQRECQRLTLEEALRNLCIPDELVGVHRSIAETTTAVHTHVGSNLCTPRHSQRGVKAIGIGPCVEI